MSEQKKIPSFNFWSSWQAVFNSLSMYERGVLITWIMWYIFEDSVPSEKADEKLLEIFYSLTPELDKQIDKYNDYLNRKQTNG